MKYVTLIVLWPVVILVGMPTAWVSRILSHVVGTPLSWVLAFALIMGLYALGIKYFRRTRYPERIAIVAGLLFAMLGLIHLFVIPTFAKVFMDMQLAGAKAGFGNQANEFMRFMVIQPRWIWSSFSLLLALFCFTRLRKSALNWGPLCLLLLSWLLAAFTLMGLMVPTF